MAKSLITKAVHEDTLPTSVEPKRLRIVQEKRFEKGVWAILLQRSWTGKTIIEAEENQRNGSKSCTFHMRIELVKPWDLLEQRGSTNKAMASAMLERLLQCLHALEY